MNKRTSKPWYREFWFWLVISPLIVTVVVSATMLSIAVRNADDTVSDTYYKDSLLYHFIAEQDKRAEALGLAAMVQFERGEGEENRLTLELIGDLEYPQQLLLTLSHPVEADLDRHVLLEQVSAGRYTGTVSGELRYRWYLRLMPETDPKQYQNAEWRLRGEINFELGDSAPLNPAVQ